jgi:hypothetical protein
MRSTIAVVAKLAEQGVIANYAIADAVAALDYIEPFLTADLDVLISVADFEKRPSGLVLLSPIDKALAEMGYTERTDAGIVIEGWPVQFLPVASPLDEEALAAAVDVEIAAAGEAQFKARCLRAEHLVAVALKVGRPKDWARIAAFLEEEAVDLSALAAVLDRHGLMDAWRSFCLRTGTKDPLR